MGEKEWDPSDVFDVLGDSLARRILVLASEEPLSADDFADQLAVSRPTIYRRINALIDYDLLRERERIDVEGSNYQEFETTLERVTFEIDRGGYNLDVRIRRQLADQFESFWTDLEESSSAPGPASDSHQDHGSSDT